MRKLAVVFLGFFFAACAAGPRPAPFAVTDLPPLIDLEKFFGDPEISGAQISPDGRWLSFIKPYRGVRNIWIKALDEPFEKARPMTADERPVVGYFWSRDGRYLLYVQDQKGNENFHVYAVDPGAPAGEKGVPPARDLTPLENIRAYIFELPKNRPDEIIVGLNDRDPSYHDVYLLRISTGERTLLRKNDLQAAAFITDLQGNLRLAFRQKEDAGWEILRLGEGQPEKIYECDFGEDCSPIRFHPDGKRVYIQTNRGDRDLTALELLDVEKKTTEPVESDPEKRVDFGGPVFSEIDDSLIATVYIDERVRIYPRDEEFKKDLEALRRQLPDGELGLPSWTRDMKLWVVMVQSDVDPGSAYLYRRAEKKAELLYRTRPDLPSEHLAQMKPVRYRARDGLEIPAYLTLPKGIEPKGLPAVIFPHGGPWARDMWGYNPFSQFLANRGYAVLQPNFRGSTGYGKRFQNLGDRQWGTGTMQHDISDGVKWLVEQGIVDPNKVAIFGGSYGGYATLAGVTFTPELYRCGVAYVAPSNLITLLESIPPYWKPMVREFHKRLGNPEVEADRRELEARSPLNFVDRIRVPLLVVHGANDPRVKQAESDRIVVALRDKGHAVEYLVAPDEGHGFRAPENRLALAVAMDRFLAKHLGGRAQPDYSPPIKEKLAALTVDPASVKLPAADRQKERDLAEKSALPRVDSGAFRDYTANYRGQLKGAKEMDFAVERLLKKVGEELQISSAVKFPDGEQKDTFRLRIADLLPVERKFEGKAALHLQFQEKSIRAILSAGGKEMAFELPLAAPAFGDGAALEAVMGLLPLTDDFSTLLRTFDMNARKVRPFKVKVCGREQVQTAAGKFDAFRVRLEALDDDPGGGQYWLRVESPHLLIKSEQQLPPAAGGGRLTLELEKLNSGT